jgi:hypothetical protein
MLRQSYLPLIGRLFSEEAQRPETDQMALQGKSVFDLPPIEWTPG